MKLLNRDFTNKEKVVLLVLIVALMALAYYNFVDQVVRREMEAAAAEREALETDLLQLQMQLAELTRMRRELEELGGEGQISYMPSYNNLKQEMTLLNSILESAEQYTISFAGVSRSGDLIRRAISLQFTTSGFQAARLILVRLESSEYRCLLGDISYSANAAGQVSISVSCTFYETMVGGEPDSLLPAD